MRKQEKEQMLTFKFNLKKIEIKLDTEKERNCFVEIPNLIKKENNNWCIAESFFSKEKAVHDVFRYNLKFLKDSWCFYNPKSGKESTENDFKTDLNIGESVTNDSNNIILILESPHKDEYEEDFTPKSPASGSSGIKIFNYFTSHVLPILFNLGLVLYKKNSYRFFIANPVQYQTSLYAIHKKGNIKSLRNKIWNKIYDEVEQDFENKLIKYKPSVILNGCTSDLKKKLENVLNKMKCCEIFNVSHPSSWHVLGGFDHFEPNKS